MVCKLNNAFPASIATRFARCGSRFETGTNGTGEDVGVCGWLGGFLSEMDLRPA